MTMQYAHIQIKSSMIMIIGLASCPEYTFRPGAQVLEELPADLGQSRLWSFWAGVSAQLGFLFEKNAEEKAWNRKQNMKEPQDRKMRSKVHRPNLVEVDLLQDLRRTNPRFHAFLKLLWSIVSDSRSDSPKVSKS